jgi:uncharacterized protein
LNEPIPGQGVFWSSVGGKPYPVAIRALSFEQMYRRLDKNYDRAAVPTFAAKMKHNFQAQLQEAMLETVRPEVSSSGNGQAPANMPNSGSSFDVEKPDLEEFTPESGSAEKPDVKETFERSAIKALKADEETMRKLDDSGVAWGTVKAFLKEKLPTTLEDRERDQLAYELVPKALNEILGPRNEAWYSFRNEQRNYTTYVKTGRNPERG